MQRDSIRGQKKAAEQKRAEVAVKIVFLIRAVVLTGI